MWSRARVCDVLRLDQHTLSNIIYSLQLCVSVLEVLLRTSRFTRAAVV
jgi:hypothetical protein